MKDFSDNNEAMKYNPVLGDIITGKCCDDHYIHKGKITSIWTSGAVTIECIEDCPKKINYPDRYHGKSAIIYKHNIQKCGNN